jgi:diacylglycerol O-acyltransferase
MAYSHFERLSALDDSFLEIEKGTSHMHIGSVATFETGPFAMADGGVDIGRIRMLMQANLHRVPRYRQRLRWIPVFDHPVWVDDDRFNLDYHVRHTHLPKPGDERQLKRLAGRVMSQELDRSKPLWEMWVVEGLEQGGFAVITKAHHCMIDGVGSVELMGSIMRTNAGDDPTLAQTPPRWIPRPVPPPRDLVLSEIWHRATSPLGAVARALAQPRQAFSSAREVAAGIRETVVTGLRSASPTPFNVEIGPYRRFDWTVCTLDDLKDVRKRHGGTVNDVVLTVLSGAISRFFRRRGIAPETLDFRVMVPVNVRDQATRRDVGNRVAMMVVGLPLGERDPLRRLARVVEETTKAKRSKQAAGVQSIEALSDSTFTSVMIQFARLTALSRPYNLVVTNVPGPGYAVYIAGARMLACHPLVPLFSNQALGIALFSYDGRLHWGFNADWDALPDLHDLVEGVERELETFRGLGKEAAAGAS